MSPNSLARGASLSLGLATGMPNSFACVSGSRHTDMVGQHNDGLALQGRVERQLRGFRGESKGRPATIPGPGAGTTERGRVSRWRYR
jgi:hypothetical protein